MTDILWTGAEIAAATGGRLAAPFDARGITFDSREVAPGDLFLAMRGAASDGHRFIDDARHRGAAGVVAEHPVPPPHVLVDDSYRALVVLGKEARRRAGEAVIIGVTGSVGKTSVKEALRHALARLWPGQVHASEKSYNNHTGVPLSLARMPRESRAAVLEMGMNHHGEIRELTRMVRPHVAIITWVGAAHLEAFPEGEEGVARAKAEIFEGVEEGGIAILPADNRHHPLLRRRARERGLRTLSFGRAADADVRAVATAMDSNGSDIDIDWRGQRLAVRVGVPGAHWIGNALAVVAAVAAVVQAAGRGADDVDAVGRAAGALADMAGLPGRGARFAISVEGGTALLIDESYNANPVSMRAALAALAQAPEGRRVAILGAMLELGPESAALHAGLADAIRAAGIAELALVGGEMAPLATALSGAHCADADAALSWARAVLRGGDVLLVKGSHSVGLGRLVAALRGVA